MVSRMAGVTCWLQSIGTVAAGVAVFILTTNLLGIVLARSTR